MKKQHLSSYGIIYQPYVDVNGNPIERTPDEYHYSYDSFVTYRNGQNDEIEGGMYSDRMSQWDYEKYRSLIKKHFKDGGDYFDTREPKQIESFLRDYTGNQNLRLILIMQHCNQASGYPCWSFEYANK